MNQNRKRGTTIGTLDDVDGESDRLHELFRVVKQELGSVAIVYAARKGARLTAVALLLRRGGTGHLPMVGVDHAAAGRDFTFFAVAHSRPIADAIAQGLRTLYLGRALYALKARRGCRLEDAVLLCRPTTRRGRIVLGSWCIVLSSWNRAKLARRAQRGPRRAVLN